MKSFLFFLLTTAVWAQPAPPSAAQTVAPDTVVATFEDGRKITAGELDKFMAAMPPNMQQAARRDRRAFVQQFALMNRLSEMAEKAKLNDVSPTKEALAFNRMYILMNAQLHDVLSSINVPAAEVQSFYTANKARYTQVKVKAIYIAYSADPAKADPKAPKRLTEAEAEAKISALRTAIAGGANFVKLVKDNSDDPTSAAKDGDFGTIRSTDNLPDPIRAAIFALKPGELSQPVKQPNGFYLFRAEEVSPEPLAEVQDQVVNELRQAHFKTWMDDVNRGLNFKIQNDAFFAETSAAPVSGK